MPAFRQPRPRLRHALALALFLAATIGLSGSAQQPLEPGKKGADPKAAVKDKEPTVVKLPDGTYLWLGNTDGNGERITLTPAELQKLLDQIDQLKKQIAAKKTVAPSECAVRGRVEKRGDQLVAVLKLTDTFRTTAPQTAVALGGRRAFLVAAALDGNKLPVLDTTEDGFAVLVETPGNHTLTLDLEAPVTSRGAKPELGFEIGLPRAPISTVIFDPPGPDVKRVNLTTRTPDPAKPGPGEPRRTAAIDITQFAKRPGHEGHALGPVDSLELTWDPPAAAAQPADHVQLGNLTVVVLLTEGVVESTAKIRLSGPAREWKFIAPANADVSVDRAAAGTEVGPTVPPVVTRPTDANKPVWKIAFPAGSPAADWVVTAVTRQPRPKVEDAKHRGPFPVGPFTVLDVLRQTGTVQVKAAPHTHLAFKHGPDLRTAEAPKADPPAPVEDEATTAFFRLTTGPTGTTAVPAPLLTVEAWPQPGAVAVKPTYRLTLTDSGWKVRAEVKVLPIRTDVATLAVDVPADWRGLEVSPPELVESVQQGSGSEGFWAAAGLRLAHGLRVPVTIRLAAGHKQPFDLVLTATVPVEPGDVTAIIPLPRFPGSAEKETTVTATVPEGYEVRGESRDWHDEFAAWGTPLLPASASAGKARVASTITGNADAGLAGITLAWNPQRHDLAAEIRAAVTVGERQLDVVQWTTLRSADGFSRPVRFRAPPGASVSTRTGTGGTRATLTWAGGSEWLLTPTDPGAKELSFAVNFAVNLPPRPPEGKEWKVPVGLLWPVGATRADATVRVWSNAASGRTIVTASNGWRELSVEASPDRDSLPPALRDTLPALTLAASETEMPLMLDVREASDPAAVAVWVERGLVQAWAANDGATEYRARFLLRRWLAPSVEIRLPGPLAGPNPEFLRDGLKVAAVPVGDASASGRAFRIPLPDAAPGKTSIVEVRYQLPIAPGGTGEAMYQPPTLVAGALVGPVRWQITLPAGTMPLLTAGATAEFHWRLRPTGLLPTAFASAEGLEKWFRTGDEPGADDAADGETLTARQAGLGALSVYRASRSGFVIICSIVVFVLVLAVSRLPGWAIGPAVAVMAGAVGIAAVFLPQPAAQVAGASQPGLAGAAIVLLVMAWAKLYHRRRITRLPGFARTAQEPSTPTMALPSSARNRPQTLGSSSPAPAAPAGG